MNNPTPDRARIHLDLSAREASDIMDDLPLGHSVTNATRNLYIYLREELRSQTQGEPMAKPSDCDDDGVIYAPPQVVRPMPSRQPARGAVTRKVDVSGVSGLGHIVEFCVFSDGATAIRWLGGPPQNQPKFEFYDNPGIQPFIQISGHNGNTEVIWIDNNPDAGQLPGQ
jgi:hypothetical protein